MAKMFYTLEEAAQKLGVDQQKVKEMAASGQLQQFRDRDKLMFKRDQVDGLAGASASGSGPLPAAESAPSDAVDLGAEESTADPSSSDSTGLSVFETGEVKTVDPSAQTHLSDSSEEGELALDSVGSGSGLLDLTRESDDTSLGAELLDEIYPGAGESGVDSKIEPAVGTSGVFESALGMETGHGTSTGLEAVEGSGQGMEPPGAVAVALDLEVSDPIGSGFGAGMFIGTTAALVIGLIVAISAVSGVNSAITNWMTISDGRPSNGMVWIWAGGLLVLCLLLGGIGALIGKAASK